jgi:hypothetical protein
MGRCALGPGATSFCQGVIAQSASDAIPKDIVEWVEHSVAPDRLTGAKFVNDKPVEGVAWESAHCRYISVLDNIQRGWGPLCCGKMEMQTAFRVVKRSRRVLISTNG